MTTTRYPSKVLIGNLELACETRCSCGKLLHRQRRPAALYLRRSPKNPKSLHFAFEAPIPGTPYLPIILTEEVRTLPHGSDRTEHPNPEVIPLDDLSKALQTQLASALEVLNTPLNPGQPQAEDPKVLTLDAFQQELTQ